MAKVIIALGNDISTDDIYPGRFMATVLPSETPQHAFSDRTEFNARLRAREFPAGSVIVGGENFGCGSSREQATAAVKFAGVGAVIAASFARIFFRNSINLGLPAVVSPEASAQLAAGDELEIDLVGGTILKVATGETFRAAPLDPRAVELLQAGGLIPYLKKKYAG